MKSFFRRIDSFTSSPSNAPWLFLAVAILAYGLLFWRHGFYWDDLPMTWIRYELGPAALTKYFSTARPVWAWVYQATTFFLPQVPWVWQVVAILTRWLSVLILWRLVRALWPGREHMALLTGLLFLLYPGFNLQWVAFLTTHFYIVICFFLLSFWFMLQAMYRPERYWQFTILALLLSAMNLWMLEFFYFVEFVRVVIIVYVLLQARTIESVWEIARRAMTHWSVYFLLFIANVFYRMFVFTNVAYQNKLLTDLSAYPLSALTELFKTIFSTLWVVFAQAWGTIFSFPKAASDGPLTTAMYIAVVLAVATLTFAFFRRTRNDADQRPIYWAIFIGFTAMLLGGGPYWLAKLDVILAFPASRFTMSFMLGASLLMAAMIELLPRRIRTLLIVLILCLAAGRQTLIGDEYLRDWQSQKNMLWQMSWRMPGLQPDTLILMNEELTFYADNSLGAALNWIYDPRGAASDINFALFYPTNRIGGSLPALQAGLPIQFGYIAGDFNGNTSQVVAIYYSPPGCVHVLDAEIDTLNHFIPLETLMRDAAALSSSEWILPDEAVSPPKVYAPEPAHGWCYYFERADLARQLKDWGGAVRLGEIAFGLADHPNDPTERYVFIEAYAHVGDWAVAFKLSDDSYRVSKDFVRPSLCALWARIARETEPNVAQSAAVSEAIQRFDCK